MINDTDGGIMKISYSTLGCPDWSFSEIFATAKDLGYDGVEIRGVKKELYAPAIQEFRPEKRAETLATVSRLGVSIPCLTSGICVREYGTDSAEDERMRNDAEAYVRTAKEFGIKYIRILGDKDVMPQGEVDDARVENALKDFIACSAAEGDAVFLLETNGVYGDTKRLAKIVEKIGDDRLAVLWDIHHPYRFFGEKIEDSYNNIAPFIKHVHVKDSVVLEENRAVRYKMTGKGDIPVEDAVNILLRNSFDGFVSLEWVKRWCADLEAPGIVFVQYINYMRRLLRKNA